MLEIETRLTPSTCVDCGYMLDTCSGEADPKPGDITICIRCAGINAFDKNLILRRPTEKELVEIGGDPGMKKIIEAIHRLNKDRLDADA